METAGKTIREWLETLPEPYRTQALENAKNAGGGALSDIRKSAANAIHGAFPWGYTPQGAEYWALFYTQLVKSPTPSGDAIWESSVKPSPSSVESPEYLRSTQRIIELEKALESEKERAIRWEKKAEARRSIIRRREAKIREIEVWQTKGLEASKRAKEYEEALVALRKELEGEVGAREVCEKEIERLERLAKKAQSVKTWVLGFICALSGLMGFLLGINLS